MVASASDFLVLLPLAAAAVVTAASERTPLCSEGGECWAGEDASFLQVQSAETSLRLGSLSADVWLTSIAGNAQVEGVLEPLAPVRFRPGQGQPAFTSWAAGRVPRAPMQQGLPSMQCRTMDGAASRACEIVPPRLNGSLVQRQAQGSPSSVTVDASMPKQTMRGFGAAMTQSSAVVMQRLRSRDEGLYNETMERLFGTGSLHAGISMVRFPIGSCDYSTTQSTYADVPQGTCHVYGECDPSCSKPGHACSVLAEAPWIGEAGNCPAACNSDDCGHCRECQECCCVAADYQLASFGLDPETQKIVLTLQKAKEINPDLVLVGSPWTAPRWLKTRATLEGGGRDNTLLSSSDAYETYARYFLKIKEAFGQLGLPLDYLTLQNEPLFAPAYPGMFLSAGDAAALGQKVKALIGDKPKLLAYDHNWDHPEYPLEAIEKAPGVFTGTAFHCYAGSMTSAHRAMLDKHPDMEIFMTECMGSYPDRRCDVGRGMDSFGWNHEWDMTHLLLNNALHGGSAGTKWNMVLDERCGPYLPNMDFHWGRPLVSVPSWARRVEEVKFNQDFWTVAHMGRFVRPGAERIETTVTAGGSRSLVGAFRDLSAGTVTLMAVNLDHSHPLDLEVVYEGQQLSYSVPKWGTAIFRWPL